MCIIRQQYPLTMEKEVIFVIFRVKDQHAIVHNLYHISETDIFFHFILQAYFSLLFLMHKQIDLPFTKGALAERCLSEFLRNFAEFH